MVLKTTTVLNVSKFRVELVTLLFYRNFESQRLKISMVDKLLGQIIDLCALLSDEPGIVYFWLTDKYLKVSSFWEESHKKSKGE